jgi:hypothetical protein
MENYLPRSFRMVHTLVVRAAPCQFIILVDNLVIAVGVQ